MLVQEAASIAHIAKETGLTCQPVCRIEGDPAGALAAWGPLGRSPAARERPLSPDLIANSTFRVEQAACFRNGSICNGSPFRAAHPPLFRVGRFHKIG